MSMKALDFSSKVDRTTLWCGITDAVSTASAATCSSPFPGLMLKPSGRLPRLPTNFFTASRSLTLWPSSTHRRLRTRRARPNASRLKFLGWTVAAAAQRWSPTLCGRRTPCASPMGTSGQVWCPPRRKPQLLRIDAEGCGHTYVMSMCMMGIYAVSNRATVLPKSL